jgi:hypothetical protein
MSIKKYVKVFLKPDEYPLLKIVDRTYFIMIDNTVHKIDERYIIEEITKTKTKIKMNVKELHFLAKLEQRETPEKIVKYLSETDVTNDFLNKMRKLKYLVARISVDWSLEICVIFSLSEIVLEPVKIEPEKIEIPEPEKEEKP